MKLLSLFAAATTLATVAMSQAIEPPVVDGRYFEQVKLTEPLDWQAGKSLFPSRVIAGYHADLDEYDAEAWAEYVLEQCKRYKSCTTAAAFQATNSGDEPKTRFWFGYAFRGGPTTEKDFVRNEDVSDSIAYTIVLRDEDL